ncbi:MAG TPA: hypothetical protein VFN56_01590 [Candidatus Saccharimonadales bacterium]|nr:hypothetical protein [Candidatus Saccharimonadales bacterium]
MDNFDHIIKEAQEPVAPSARFVDATMSRIVATPTRRHGWFRFWTPVIAGSLAVLVLLFIFVPHGNKTVMSPAPSPSQPSSAATTPVAAIAPGTDNASLDSDLQSLSSELDQNGGTLNSANSAVNDQQQAIAVPTQ